MRVLALSPGPLAQQLDRLPALVSLCEQVGATLQVACAPACRGAWDLVPQVEKILPFDFEAAPTLADWANLLGCVREPDFQVCLNFAEGRQVNLMLSMSHIPTRIASSGFSSTEIVSPGEGWCAQRLASVLKPLGCDLDADRFRLALSSTDLDAARAEQPAGEGPMLLLAPAGSTVDWPEQRWRSLPEAIAQRLKGLRTLQLNPDLPINRRAAAVASADVVLSSCPVSQKLAIYSGVPLVALGAEPQDLPDRPDIRCLGTPGNLSALADDEVLQALGF
ncbi:MAG: lipopolysaccharide heptosyltransferase family protein [Synechococcus sp. MED-G133]|jgi:ADP-heptose:LPS heptosyltransferase|uniref:glycosyltransferase family 9 protein n=1 Tax=Synechococcus sp. A15-28 TaxID=1050638 RepID=UPI0011F763E8|nr:lipopolysaccharide heptosyltransferase family protein [Synechococcus sp. A15-28]MBA4732876.1 lipopolysaccharide heptosyltransferase family protein [Synechococcus sp.]QNI43056.1 UDP-glycosyltransferase/glycogen phosphorylase [Synechococcus sp. A15-28]RZO09781.1 MAG: lipopolysaccharide heptosyltransferase family protein [Synechococcus sp. MED-G133]|tara:strand:- start:330 stop:1163 length:834 start_codon:yes stop_codon:yes gene_type:complete